MVATYNFGSVYKCLKPNLATIVDDRLDVPFTILIH